jgi:hypothetical protein
MPFRLLLLFAMLLPFSAARADVAVLDIGHMGHRIVVAPDRAELDWQINRHGQLVGMPEKTMIVRCQGTSWMAVAHSKETFGAACGLRDSNSAKAAALEECRQQSSESCYAITSGYDNGQLQMQENRSGHWSLVDMKEERLD